MPAPAVASPLTAESQQTLCILDVPLRDSKRVAGRGGTGRYRRKREHVEHRAVLPITRYAGILCAFFSLSLLGLDVFVCPSRLGRVRVMVVTVWPHPQPPFASAAPRSSPTNHPPLTPTQCFLVLKSAPDQHQRSNTVFSEEGAIEKKKKESTGHLRNRHPIPLHCTTVAIRNQTSRFCLLWRPAPSPKPNQSSLPSLVCDKGPPRTKTISPRRSSKRRLFLQLVQRPL